MRPVYLYNGNSYTGNITYLYWDGPQNTTVIFCDTPLTFYYMTSERKDHTATLCVALYIYGGVRVISLCCMGWGSTCKETVGCDTEDGRSDVLDVTLTRKIRCHVFNQRKTFLNEISYYTRCKYYKCAIFLTVTSIDLGLENQDLIWVGCAKLIEDLIIGMWMSTTLMKFNSCVGFQQSYRLSIYIFAVNVLNAGRM